MADKIRLLAEAELASVCSKFYDVPEILPSGAVLAAFEEPMSADCAVLPENINDIFCADKKADNGYCMIPAGESKPGAYAVVTTRFPGATNEMIKWWFAWRGLESVNYTVSNSAHNHSVGMSVEHKAKIKNAFIPLDAKVCGIIQSCVKYTGACDMEDFIVHFQRPEEMAIDASNFAADHVTFIGGWYMREDRKCNDPYKKGIDEFAHVCIEDEEGVTVTTHIWCGYRGLKGSNMRMDTYGPVIDEAYAKQIGLAYAQDMAQIASVLPEMYQITGGTL